jgi:ferredoxin-type protein NapG
MQLFYGIRIAGLPTADFRIENGRSLGTLWTMADPTRRQLLYLAGGVLAGGCAGGLFRLAVADDGQALLLRPPGAGSEADLLAACIRCGQCVQACPYETLHLADLREGKETGTPYLNAREVPCYLCDESIYDRKPQCIEACPTTALMPVESIRDIRMGLAVLDESTCWAYNDQSCQTCWQACPLRDEAIHMVRGDGRRRRPVVDEDACVGCGLCVNACPTDPTSIDVTPESALPADVQAKRKVRG